MARQRLSWVDLAKVVSICLVTSYHTAPPLTGYAAQMVQLLRMPAFFLIAGFLFDDRKFPTLWSLVKHRARQLLIPYGCFEALLIALTSRSWDDCGQSLVNALLGHPTTCYPLWFLMCLFGMQVTHYLGIRLTDRLTQGQWQQHRLQLLGAYIVCCTLLSPLELTQHLQLNAIVQNLPFYAAANCAKDLVSRIDWRQKKTATCLICGLLLVIVKYRWQVIAGEDGIVGSHWLTDMAYYLTHLTAGLLLLPPYIACCKAIGEAIGHRHLIEYLGSNTVVILALHTYYIIVLSHVIDQTMGADTLGQHPWLNPLLTLLIVLGHYPIIWAINRWLPWMLGRGHRTAAQ